MIHKSEIKEINWSSSYTRQKPPITVAYNTYLHYWHIHQILKYYITRGSSVLECGCAPAQWLVYFSKEFDCSLYGIDNSQSGLYLSKENLCYQNIKKCELIKGDVNYIPFDNNTFDVVFSTGLLEHFNEPEKIVSEMSRILKPGGLLIIQIPNFHKGSLLWFIEDVIYRKNMDKTHSNLYLNDIESWLKNQNMRIIFSSYIGIYLRHGILPCNKHILKFTNRYTAQSFISIGEKEV